MFFFIIVVTIHHTPVIEWKKLFAGRFPDIMLAGEKSDIYTRWEHRFAHSKKIFIPKNNFLIRMNRLFAIYTFAGTRQARYEPRLD